MSDTQALSQAGGVKGKHNQQKRVKGKAQVSFSRVHGTQRDGPSSLERSGGLMEKTNDITGEGTMTASRLHAEQPRAWKNQG